MSIGNLGAAGLGSGVVLDMQLKQAPFAHHRGRVGDVGYGAAAHVYYLLSTIHTGKGLLLIHTGTETKHPGMQLMPPTPLRTQ